MSKPALFEPIRLDEPSLADRIVIAPMCQYSARAGCMNDWHLRHPGRLAMPSTSLLTIEASVVVPAGPTTSAGVGLWDDRTEAAMRRTVEGIRWF